MKTPAIIATAAVAAAAILSGGGIAAAAMSHHATPVAATVPAPTPTKTVIKKVHDKTTVVVPAAPAPTAPALRDTGNGIYAGPNTSAAFAQNVADSWNGYDGVQEIYSPVTGQTYAMTYTTNSANGTVTAAGGNGALVQFNG